MRAGSGGERRDEIAFDLDADSARQQIVVPLDRLERLTGCGGGSLAGMLRPACAVGAIRDEVVRGCIARLGANAASRDAVSVLMGNGLLLTFAARLLQLAERARERPAGALGPSELDRLGRYVAARLDGRISTSELATQVSRSPSSFGRAFRNTVGRTPCDWIMHERVTRACELLGLGRDSIAEVANACGFCSQSYMTDVFRERLDTTPARYRRDHASASARTDAAAAR